MDYKKKFYEKYVSTHINQIYGPVSREDLKHQFIFNDAHFGSLVPRDKSAAILDIGCGNGSFVLWLEKIGFRNVFGIDISPEQIMQGKNLGIKSIAVADFREFLKEHLGTYDMIFARDVLEHLDKEEILDILDLVRGALKLGGAFVSQTANAENLLWGRLRHADFTHDIAFTSLSMRQLLLMTGFGAVAIYPQRPVVHGFFSLVRRVLWHCIEIALRLYLLIETGSANGIFTQNIITKAERAA
jgi:2-polyprenyl-3-methyl-5-hydroxy-6-metoxy-1,4-benzoquinol methylase